MHLQSRKGVGPGAAEATKLRAASAYCEESDERLAGACAIASSRKSGIQRVPFGSSAQRLGGSIVEPEPAAKGTPR